MLLKFTVYLDMKPIDQPHIRSLAKLRIQSQLLSCQLEPESGGPPSRASLLGLLRLCKTVVEPPIVELAG